MKTERYKESVTRLPKEGRHIVASQPNGNIVVYQAYRQPIADYAVEHKQFEKDFSYNRMSWIKPNFLWMMYRSGWATKEEQENILAITISTNTFDMILQDAVVSSFDKYFYTSEAEWKRDLEAHGVRLQWDPDHDLFGNKIERRAIQLGLKGNILYQYGKELIIDIQNITPFVVRQREILEAGRLDDLEIPYEEIYRPASETLASKIALS